MAFSVGSRNGVRAMVVVLLGAIAIGSLGSSTTPLAQSSTVDAAVFSTMRWRNVGPFAGGRTHAPAGSANAHEFYVAVEEGGIWKTTDAGGTWNPVFDAENTSTIGAIAVAPVDGSTVYAGTWQAHARNAGLYRSSNGGATWTRVALEGSRKIAKIVLPRRSEGTVLVAVTEGADPNGPGVFRLSGSSFTAQQVLRATPPFAATDLEIGPGTSATAFAVLSQADSDSGVGAEVHRSTDAGMTWAPVRFPPSTLENAIDVDVAFAGTDARRVFALVRSSSRDALYRSDDDGLSWRESWSEPSTASSPRLRLSGDPLNGNVVFLSGRGVRRSTDAGETFHAWGQRAARAMNSDVWVSETSGVRLVTSDQGAIVTLNDGATWSTSENQPTGRYEGLVADRAFPYELCAMNTRELTCVSSRRDPVASRTVRLSAPAGTRVAPDPSDGDVLFLGTVRRYDRRTGQSFHAAPPPAASARDGAPQPLVFAPTDPRTMYFGGVGLWRSTDRGQTWTSAGPAPENGLRIGAIAPSPVTADVVWVADATGSVWVTRDRGTSWRQTPLPEPLDRAVSVAASHFDSNAAYVSGVSKSGRSVAYLTRDGGTTWRGLHGGLPADVQLTVLREDPYRRGLLVAGSDAGPFVSFDDGDTWQSVRLNLPPTSVTDIVIKDADIAIATGGRGLWMLEDVAPLRQLTANTATANMFLLRPSTAWRLRRSEVEPGGLSPLTAPVPEPAAGVLLTYHLAREITGTLAMEIVETTSGEVLKRFSSGDPDPLPRRAGLHRIPWDLRYAPPAAASLVGEGPSLAPGTYQIRLTAGVETQRQALIVRMDPRVTASAADLGTQFTTLKRLYDAGRNGTPESDQIAAVTLLYDAIRSVDARPSPGLAAAVDGLLGSAPVTAR